MNKDNFDTETTKELSEADALKGMFASTGWKIAEQEMENIVAELRDARNLQADDLALELKVNLAVAENLEAWVAELKGRVDNAIIMTDDKSREHLLTRR